MKGLSTILAMILIVIIVVALIGLTYTFAANLFSTTTDTATSSVTTTTKNMDKHVSVIGDAGCIAGGGTVGGYNITFTIKHDGSSFAINSPPTLNELSMMVGSAVIANENVTTTGAPGVSCVNCMNNTLMNPQTMKTFKAHGVPTSAGSIKFYLVTPAGQISESITCP